MHIKPTRLALGCCLSLTSLTSFAGSMGAAPPPPVVDDCPWTITGSLGYAGLNGSDGGQGQSGVGRLGIGKTFRDYGRSSLGFEIGVQNGTTMQLFLPEATQDILGGVPVTVTVKPLLDLLATWRFTPLSTTAMFGDVKLGAAYRRMDAIGRQTVNNKSQFAGEVQAGLGMPITDVATLSLLYQGIYGADINFKANAETATGLIGNIPVQNGVLLSLNIAL
ncbi:MAG: hypothetical protein P1U36_03820 [Legionellaceae bacterium]|nr:hypothetical protein [Legionellaceae bacterium]